ncbi:uncharacterized protein LOC132871010 isoform X2 [Neoarius graeffei]|uniref:uncharacterized protein LOC132871010 isoform X2 n=1 Tax=Neoarius graeffei TaxID=443677 RepID=UPI00298BD5C0|nr:uncharacterized protein LOC132871010 isoform X2 [Neoarius graeffei]
MKTETSTDGRTSEVRVKKEETLELKIYNHGDDLDNPPEDCEVCKSFFLNKCEVHGPPVFIPDTPVPMGVPDRARQTLPPGLEIQKSSIPDAGLGVFNKGETVPVGAHFGPYQGELGNREEARNSGDPSVAKGKRRIEKVSETEEREEVTEREERERTRSSEEEDEDHDSGQQARSLPYSFGIADEERLVDFFRANPCFYDKTLDLYSNAIHKRKLTQGIATELHTTVAKVNGWFRNQRTAVGKLLKKRSGQALEALTARKRWQLQNFVFLRDHIVPRSYMSDTGTLPSSESRTSRGASTSEEEDRASDRSTSSRAYVQAQKKRSKKIDDVILEYILRPRPSEAISQKIEAALAASSAGPQDERTALGNWLVARIAKVPDERWEDFTVAAQNLMREFTKPIMPPPQAPDTSLPPRIPSQQFWQQPLQQTWQQPLQQTWQQPLQQTWQQPLQQTWQQPLQQTWQQPLQQTWQHDPPRCHSTPMRQVQQISVPLPRPHSAGPPTAGQFTPGSTSGESFSNMGLSDSFLKQVEGRDSRSTPTSQRAEDEDNVSD